MKTLWTIVKIAAGVLVVAALALSAYVSVTWDKVWDVPEPALRASTDPAAIARGEYLAFGPAHCVECHSDALIEFEDLGDGMPLPALKGGIPFALGPLGLLYTKNLTPDPETGIGRYSDGQVARMLRHGVRPDGVSSIPLLMPFSEMSDEDIVGILSFLRSRPPVKNAVPDNEWSTVGKVMKSFVSAAQPKTDNHPPALPPPSAPTVERGQYLARSVANCGGCHTEFNPMTGATIVPDFSGGGEMEPMKRKGADPTLWFRPPNITPRVGSALLKFPDRATFVARFRTGGRQFAGSPMPWEAFSRMTPDDLGAIYEYLKTVPAEGAPSIGEPTVRH